MKPTGSKLFTFTSNKKYVYKIKKNRARDIKVT